jgi:N-methylhydantoinase B
MSTTTSARPGGSEHFLTADDVQERYGIDLITAETLRAAFIQATRQMHDTLTRSAFSNVVRENLDMGVAAHLVEPEGTEQVAITEGACHFAFTFQHMTNLVVDEWGIENFGPGDTLICNDNWRGAIHFPDVNLFRPVFWEGEPVFMLSDAAHIVDIGGPIPGGFNSDATTFYEEGLRIPPMLILSGDKPVRSTINLLLENTRTPMHNLGDLRALFGTMKVGEARLLLLFERYGLETVRAAARYTLDLAERRMRREIEAVPDGTFEAEAWLDDGGMGGDPVRIFASARVAGSDIEIDYSGSDRQPIGAATTCWEETSRCLIGAKLILDRRHPMNAGAMRPFHVVAPPGSVVMGTPPTSSSQHPEVGSKTCALMTELFGKMMPDRAVATETGSGHVYFVGGDDAREGREGLPFGAVLAGGAAWGGTSVNDGISFNITAIFNVADNVIELLERDNPILIRGRNLLVDAAGVGRFRSGYSSTLMVEALDQQPLVYFSAFLGSGKFPRAGAVGGGDGMTSYLYKIRSRPDHQIHQRGGAVPLEDLVPLVGLMDADGAPQTDGGTWHTTEDARTLMVSGYEMAAGEVMYILCATGGGYGDPLERDPELVREDVWNEKLSIPFAAEAYGVVIDPATLTVKPSETVELRERRGAESAGGEWAPPISGYRPWPRTWDELTEQVPSPPASAGETSR